MELFGQQLSWLEITGTLFGIAGVYLTFKKNILCFAAGIINVSLYAILFYQSKLFADAVLQLVYIVLLLYGWYKWSSSASEKFVAETTSAKQWLILSMLAITFSILTGSFFKMYTEASVPYLDSSLMVVSLIAQWMVARKKLENWLVWIAADIAYVGMYIYKDLYLTAALYFIFILLAVAGYIEWKKSLMRHAAAN